VNIIANAVAAIEDFANAAVDIQTMVVPKLNTARIEISDNGTGIPPKLRDRVLEPYFSTKDEGTGLGLAIVNQIVSDHGGYLRIAGNEPRGTKIIIELPMGIGKSNI
jgi:two-component system nitrogen regulation sensor histidine kinase NtrY